MTDLEDYQLLDFGQGRRLEQFGQWRIDRPAPAADALRKRNPTAWSSEAARFERIDAANGRWKLPPRMPAVWQLAADIGVDRKIMLELKPTDSGHLGIFPEQVENWRWIARRVTAARRPLKVLNLFAYTGGSTLAAAAAGAEVTHIDSAKNVLSWARRNAELSGLAAAPIRWIAEDAALFVRRELRRGNRYDAVILDPPSYGHGPKGEAWKLAADLPQLLSDCAKLTADSRAMLLLTCHTPGYGPAELEALLADTFFGHCQAGVRAEPLTIPTEDGRELLAGVAARWPSP